MVLGERKELSDSLTHRLLFPPKNRLLTPQGYQRVFKQGKKHRSACFTFIFCANEFSYARLGLAIAKRHIPLAVGRNRVRRIIRESFRQYQALFGGVDIVVIAQKELHDISNTCLREELNQRWQRFIASLNKSY